MPSHMQEPSRRELTLFQAGYCAADAGVAFDFRQPEHWRAGWLRWSENQIANAVRTLRAPNLTGSPSKSPE